MDMGFTLRSSQAYTGNLAHIVYAEKHNEYLHIILRDHKGNLYPSRYAVWSAHTDLKEDALARLQMLVDAMHLEELQNTHQLVNEIGVPFDPVREHTDSAWFVNPCVNSVSGARSSATLPNTEVVPKSAVVPDDALPPPPEPPFKKPVEPSVAVVPNNSVTSVASTTVGDDSELQGWGDTLEDL